MRRWDAVDADADQQEHSLAQKRNAAASSALPVGLVRAACRLSDNDSAEPADLATDEDAPSLVRQHRIERFETEAAQVWSLERRCVRLTLRKSLWGRTPDGTQCCSDRRCKF